jgi:transcription antitermination factor NusG
MPWYALYCRSSQERIVVDRLASAGIDAFYAHRVETVPAHRKDGTREIERKFFPGYVFAKFDLMKGTRAVIEIPQVVSILGWGNRPIPIPDFEVEAVRLLASTPEVKAATACPFVTAGDRVRVKHGPLHGLEGFVVYTKGMARVIVTLTMLARSICAEVDTEAVELLGPAMDLPVAA